MVEGMRGKLAGAAMGAALMAGASAPAQAQSAVPEVRIGMLDDGSSNLGKEPNAKIVFKHFTNRPRAGWTGDTLHSHGEMVAISAVQAARAVAPQAKITVFSSNIYSPSDTQDLQKIRYRIDWEAAHKALDWMKEQGVSVVSFTGTGRDTQAMRDLASHVDRNGMVMVASTNNIDSRDKVYPAAYPQIVSVAGNDPTLPIARSETLASYVNFVAPGRAPARSGGEIGSSFAAGTVAGWAAAYSSTQPQTTVEGVRSWLSERSVKTTYAGVVVPTLSPASIASVPQKAVEVQQVAAVEQPKPVRSAAMMAMAAGMAR